jgi:hypothetical protein
MLMARYIGLAGPISNRLFLQVLDFPLPKPGRAAVLFHARSREIVLGRCGDGNGWLGQKFMHTIAVLAIQPSAGRTSILGL